MWDPVRAAAAALTQNDSPFRWLFFEGGPWDGQRREQPRVLPVGEHCTPHGDGPSCTWDDESQPPAQWHYRPVSPPGHEPVVMAWTPPGEPL